MDWPVQMQEGLALAAAAHADRGAALAVPGLAPDALQQATQVARELAASDGATRRRWLRELLASGPRPRPDLRGPPRALALLAPEVPRQLGRAWLAASPMPRAGYAPDRELLLVLRKLAARGQR